jgi:hypothetical protein
MTARNVANINLLAQPFYVDDVGKLPECGIYFYIFCIFIFVYVF